MNGTIECTPPARSHKKVTTLTSWVKWIQNFRIEGAEEMSKTR